MHWPRDAATRIAERDEKEALRRYLRERSRPLFPLWLEAIDEAGRRADVNRRLEQQLQSPR